MLIAEDLLLLLLDDESGKADKSSELPAALGGALLVELAMEDAVTLLPGQGMLHAATHVVPGTRTPADPLLAEALGVVEEKPRQAKALVERLGKGAKERVAERLVERGILEQREDHVLGLIPRTRWPARDASYEDDLRARLARVLIDGEPPDERLAAVISLLSAIDYAPQSVGAAGGLKRQVKRRAKEIAEGDWAAKAVKDAVDAAAGAAAAVTAGGGASS